MYFFHFCLCCSHSPFFPPLLLPILPSQFHSSFHFLPTPSRFLFYTTLLYLNFIRLARCWCYANLSTRLNIFLLTSFPQMHGPSLPMLPPILLQKNSHFHLQYAITSFSWTKQFTYLASYKLTTKRANNLQHFLSSAWSIAWRKNMETMLQSVKRKRASSSAVSHSKLFYKNGLT